MEDSMQTRGDENLFDDDITPITQAQQAEIEAQQAQEAQHNDLAEQVQKLDLQQNSIGRGRGRGNGRGRGWQRGHGPVQIQHERREGPLVVGGPDTFPGRKRTPAMKLQPVSGFVTESKPAQSARAIKVAELRRKGLEASKFARRENAPEQDGQEAAIQSAQETQTDSHATPTDTAVDQDVSLDASGTQSKVSKAPAVRGDRTNTGGVRQPKLSEEELAAKVAAAKAKSQWRAAAHARAQADADDFAERERVEHVRRTEEAKLAQMKRAQDEAQARYLGQERERNRVRKLGAQTGREWDAQKDDTTFQAPRYGDRTRYGEAQEQDLSIYEWKEPSQYYHNSYHGDSSRGNDYEGGGRGRGRGRGQHASRVRQRKWPKMEMGLEKKDPDDFPPLPRKGGDLPVADPIGEQKRIMEAAEREKKAQKEAEATERDRVLREADEYRTEKLQPVPKPVDAPIDMNEFNAERAKRAAQALEELQRSVQNAKDAEPQVAGGSWADQMANDAK